MTTLARWLKNRIMNYRIRAHFGTAYPEKISLHNSKHVLHIDPRDWRVRKKIIMQTVRGRFPRNQRFWHDAIRMFGPDTVLDIGLNYGECLFSIQYPETTRLFAFEANPALVKFVNASRTDHPNAAQMELLFQLVTDHPGGVESFFIDREWSGGSTGAVDESDYDASRYEKIVVGKTSIDATMQSFDCQPRKLFFKIDIEGFEEKALLGMQETLEQAEEAVGFIEFDPALLERAGTDVSAYWEKLKSMFQVYVFDRGNQIHAGNGCTLDQLKRLCGKHFHTDLILIKTSDESFPGCLFQSLSFS